MKTFNQNASVIYTDNEGRKIDTFVIFDTDRETGLTHINHHNLKVDAGKLVLHAKTVCKYHLPINDAFSFEMIRKLRKKYAQLDMQPKQQTIKPEIGKMVVLAKAS